MLGRTYRCIVSIAIEQYSA